jgi:Carboxypeptidase regulatory-like domain
MKMGQWLTRFAVSYRFQAFTVCLGVVLSLSATSAWAQTSQVGTVVGVVTDEQNAAVPAAAIKMTDASTNTTLTATTNNDGRYSFGSVPPATYNITIVKQGFNTYEVNGQVVEISSVLTINAVLKVGSTATTVEVSASAGAQLQTMNATVGANINSEALAKLPNMSRDVTTLAILQPGTTLAGNTAGSAADMNTYSLDGANITDDMSGNVTTYQTNFVGLGGSQTNGAPSGVIPTPIESIEEIKVNVANQTSDFNNSSGGQIQMATKRGTNAIHGSLYTYYYDTKVGSARSWTANHTPETVNGVNLGYTPIVSNHRTRYGGALGGPIIPKNFLGGKWYGFFNYEALKFPNAASYTATVPSVLLRAGIIQEPNASNGTYTAYNINPYPVTVNGTTYQPAVCPAGACDPRGIGMSPQVAKLWNQYMPLPNQPLAGDNYNTQGLLSTLRQPLTSKNYVGRIDHDFNDKWHWFATYRDLKLVSLTSSQVDIGGFFPGDTLGTPTALSPRPQQPSVWTTGVTTILTPTTTNTFVFDYLRTFWQWSDQNGPPQFPGAGGALEIGGESASALIPYNVNSQSIRQRFWDGQDKGIKDDISMLKGNHLFSFGGSYQRNNDYHSRTDNGAGVNDQVSYLSTSSGINWSSPVANAYIPTSVAPTSYTGTNGFENYYSYLTGMVSSTQVMYTRSLPSLAPLPIGTPGTDRSIIPSYTTYFNDVWHVKPSFTLTYGLGWSLEMPPYELQGKQAILVDSNNQEINAADFIAQREKAALQGSSYTPSIGYSLIGNVGAGPKYPYNPYYGEFSPRVNMAWNPHFNDGILGKVFGSGKTVIRGGYSRIFGRLNGVDLVLVPLLGPGILQGVTCVNPLNSGTCAGSNVATPQNAFRFGPDGLSAPLAAPSSTLAQPFIPGLGSNPESVDANTLDPSFKPDRTDQFTVTVQRELNSHMHLEVGYIGKIIRNEMLEENLDSVPYMTTLNGQQFQSAYAQVFQQMFFNGQSAGNVTAQPFFEAALGGSGSAYCAGYSSCTSALASKNTALFKETAVSDIWTAMTKAPSWTLGRTIFSQPIAGGSVGQATSIDATTSAGYGNYNALFVRLQTTNWHGLTAVQNFTWGRALGTGFQVQATSSETPLSIYNPGDQYGVQGYDYKFIYNLSMFYSVPYFKAQKGVLGHVLGGWTIAPLFTAQSGAPSGVSYSEGNCTGCEAFGEVTTPGTSAISGAIGEAAVGATPYTGNISVRYNEYFTGTNASNMVEGAGSVSTKTPAYGVNAFQNPAQIWSEFRPCVLGYDTSCAGGFGIRGLPTWNVDTSVTKDIGVYKERVSAKLYILVTNTLNHVQMSGPALTLTTPTSFGQITSQANTPRQMEFGIRLGF